MLFNRSVRCNFNREIRENCESLCSLFLLVCAVRVVRCSQNLNGESAGILTAKCEKTAKSLYGLFLLVRVVRVVRGSCFSTGVSVVILTAKYVKTANEKRSVPSRLEELVERRMRHCGSIPGFFAVGKRAVKRMSPVASPGAGIGLTEPRKERSMSWNGHGRGKERYLGAAFFRNYTILSH